VEQKRKRRWRWIAWGSTTIVAVYLGASWWFARSLVYPARTDAVAPNEFTVERLDDRTPLWVREAGPAPQVAFVFVHGLKGSTHQWIDAAEDLSQEGIPSVAPAMPGHAGSPHEAVGFGPHESRIVAATAAWARERWPGAKIVLCGVSMGGAACWLAAQRDPNVADAIVTESAFAQLDSAIDEWFSRGLGKLGLNVFAPTRWMANRMAGIDPSTVRPVDGARTWRRPCLVLHAGNDRLLSRQNGEQLAKAAGVELQVIPGAEHAQGYAADRAAYRDRLLELARTIR